MTAVDTLINVNVCEGAYKALCVYRSNAEAVKRLDALVAFGAVTLVKIKSEFSDESEYMRLEEKAAKTKRLKFVDLNGLSAFAMPSDGVKEKYNTER